MAGRTGSNSDQLEYQNNSHIDLYSIISQKLSVENHIQPVCLQFCALKYTAHRSMILVTGDVLHKFPVRPEVQRMNPYQNLSWIIGYTEFLMGFHMYVIWQAAFMLHK